MENQIPSHPAPLPVEESKPQVYEQKPNNFLVILLSILLLLAISAAGFFAFQTQKLVAELNAISALTMVPTTEPVPTDDPTVDWETYTNTFAGYSISYPNGWKIENVAAGSLGANPPENARYIQIFAPIREDGSIGIETIDTIPTLMGGLVEKKINDLILKCDKPFTTNTKTWCYLAISNDDQYLNFQISGGDNAIINGQLDQILYTFKFTN